MPFFIYKVKTETGETVKGRVEAPNIDQASNLLRNRNWFIISVQPFQVTELASLAALLDRVKFTDIVNFTRQLSTMITAGLPLTEAFTILEQQSKPAMRKVVSVLRKDVEGGSSLGAAMEKHPTVFSRVYIALVKAGEVAGVLDQILKRLADTLEKQREFAAKTKGALIYPIIVVIAMVAVAFIMLIFVVPRLTSLYADFNAQLPTPTRILIALSTAAQRFWWLIFGGAGAGIYALRSWKRTPVGGKALDKSVLRLPIYGVLKTQIILTELTRTLSLLLGAGISLLTALDIVSEALDNVVYREALKEVSRRVEKGMSLADAIGKFEQFPPLLGQMVSVGEETGKLDEVLLKLSAFYESESEHAIKNLTTAIEPIIMVVLGVGVGFMMIAIIMPIYNLTSQF